MDLKKTKEAIADLQSQLCCGSCNNLLKEPCNFGTSCSHLLCKGCIKNVGSNCPVCQSPFWAGDVQPSHQIAVTVSLLSKIDCILQEYNSDNVNPNIDSTAAVSNYVEDCGGASNGPTGVTGTPPAAAGHAGIFNFKSNSPEVASARRTRTRSGKIRGKRRSENQPTLSSHWGAVAENRLQVAQEGWRQRSPLSSGDLQPVTPVTPRKNETQSKKMNKRNARGETPLQVAAIKGDVDTLEELLTSGADPNVKDYAGWTPLHEAAQHGFIESVRVLLDFGADVDCHGGVDKITALHDAIFNTHTDIVKLLLSWGASQSIRDKSGNVAAHYAESRAMKRAMKTPVDPENTASRKIKVLKLEEGVCDEFNVKSGCFILLGTGLSDTQMKHLDLCGKLLKGKVVSDFTNEVTHLVASCNSKSLCARTLKFMCALATGKWILSNKWVETVIKMKGFVGEEDYQVVGTTQSPDSLAPQQARLNVLNKLPPLFDGMIFFVRGKFKPPSPNRDKILQLLELCGANIVQREPKYQPDPLTPSPGCPYHIGSDHPMAGCLRFIVFDDGKNCLCKISKSRTGDLCTVPVSWLLACISNFTILPLL